MDVCRKQISRESRENARIGIIFSLIRVHSKASVSKAGKGYSSAVGRERV